MGRSILLWLLGVPIPIIILLLLFWRYETKMQAPVAVGAASLAEESSAPAIRWGAVLAGAVVAAAATVILMLVGSGLGLSMVSPWSGESASLTSLTVGAAVWLVIVQWLSSALGGYMAGRLRTKWVAVHTDEVLFRDTAHGLLAWAVATLILIGMLGSAVSSLVGSGVQAASTVASGAALGAAASADDMGGGNLYYVDTLFRPSVPASATAPAPGSPPTAPAPGSPPAAGALSAEDAAAQASRILLTSAASGTVSDADKAYLGQLVSARTGLSEADATARVDQVLAQIEDAKVKAQEAADTARSAAATAALLGALSLLIGAFIAAAAAAFGGSLRDDDVPHVS